MGETIADRLSAVNKQIWAAAEGAGRSAEDVTLVAVSKMHPAAAIREAISAGTAVFGENKVQEAEGKINEIGKQAVWHLIGHLQSNKARKAVRLFDVVHTVDSIELADRLERICIEENRESLSVLVQVDLAGETTKSGIAEADLPALADFLVNCRRLKFDGLMIIPPAADDPDESRPFFSRLREIRDRMQSRGLFSNGRGHLSMGMSHDFETAIQEGATLVRVGTAIFGARNYENG
jgi:PLP dependent protein